MLPVIAMSPAPGSIEMPATLLPEIVLPITLRFGTPVASTFTSLSVIVLPVTLIPVDGANIRMPAETTPPGPQLGTALVHEKPETWLPETVPVPPALNWMPFWAILSLGPCPMMLEL